MSKITGEYDILVSQFSYAAWKGGKENVVWRRLAAKEKLETLILQASHFKPKILEPFASYVFFSNKSNFYLNDAANKPQDVINAFEEISTKIKVMKPFEILSDLDIEIDNSDALDFWSEAYQNALRSSLQEYEAMDLEHIQASFKSYRSRVFKNNSRWLLKLVRYFSPIYLFKPVNIKINDLDITIRLDLFTNPLE